MSTSSDRNQSYSKKILKLLGSKRAISESELTELMDVSGPSKYALTRSLKGLSDTGLVETHHSGRQTYASLTKDGKRKLHSISLESDAALVDPNWDGKWRIVMLDLPEDRKTEREGLRYLLKKAGFVCLKNAVWISPQPFEHLFMNIKKDLDLTTEIMIFVTDTLDSATEEVFKEIVK